MVKKSRSKNRDIKMNIKKLKRRLVCNWDEADKMFYCIRQVWDEKEKRYVHSSSFEIEKIEMGSYVVKAATKQ